MLFSNPNVIMDGYSEDEEDELYSYYDAEYTSGNYSWNLIDTDTEESDIGNHYSSHSSTFQQETYTSSDESAEYNHETELNNSDKDYASDNNKSEEHSSEGDNAAGNENTMQGDYVIYGDSSDDGEYSSDVDEEQECDFSEAAAGPSNINIYINSSIETDTTKKVQVLPLRIARSFEHLESLSKLKPLSRYKVSEQIEKLDRLWFKANDKLIEPRNEELAYMHLKKYIQLHDLLIIDRIKIIDSHKKEALINIDKLATSLQKRYKNKNRNRRRSDRKKNNRKTQNVKEKTLISGVEGNWENVVKEGEVPKGAIIGVKKSKGKDTAFIARFETNDGSILPGKYVPKNKKCIGNYKGKEISSKNFEVLCDTNLAWYPYDVKYKYQFQPDVCPIIGGYDNHTDQILYIGRVHLNNNSIIGKVEFENRKCRVLVAEGEIMFDSYDLLICMQPKERYVAGILTKIPSTYLVKKTNSYNIDEINKFRVEPVEVLKESISSHTKQTKIFEMIELKNTSREYLKIAIKMQNTIKVHRGIPKFTKYNIIKIEKITNKKLLNYFQFEVKKIKDENNGDANIKELFHGSKICKLISENGFDERHSKTSGMFGAGIYFADESSKSNHYSHCEIHNKYCPSCTRTMLICNVALGKIKEHTNAICYSHAPPGYHSVKGVPSSNGLAYPEYVIYKGHQAYPQYLVTYTVDT